MKKKMFDGDKVKAIISESGYNIREIASRAHVGQGTLSNWLNGNRNPKRANIKRLAEVLGLKISDISDYSDSDIRDISKSDMITPVNRDALYDRILEEFNIKVSETSQLQTSVLLGVSQSYVSSIIHKEASIENMALSTFFKLFPNAEVNLNTASNKEQDARTRLIALANTLTEEQCARIYNMTLAVYPEYNK